MNVFPEPTTRVSELREEILGMKSTVCTERAKIITQAYKEYENQPVVIKRALALKSILEKMTITIDDRELICGNQASVLRAAPIFPEYAVDWIVEELDEFEKRPGDRFYVTEDQKQELREICAYWQGKTLKDHGLAMLPEEARASYDNGVIRAEGNLTSGDGHIAVNFQKVLDIGILGIKKEVERKIDSLDLADYTQLKQSYFLKAVKIVLDAVVCFAQRYSKLAFEKAVTEKNTVRKSELLEMARICSKVPFLPAETFYEGIQSVWFIQLVLQIESNGHSVSLGRLDQYLYPCYQHDKKEGLLDDNLALELLENLWIKLYSINKIRSWSHTKFSAGSPLYQNVTIAGQTSEGKDAANELSRLILKSVAVTRLTQPNLTVRYHNGLSPDFMMLCVEVIRLGFGMPAFNSDEAIIPALIDLGVSRKDAYNYSAVGCVEVAVPGKWGYRCTGMSFINFAKVLLIALNDGTDADTDRKFHRGIGTLADFKDFETVMRAWSDSVKYFARQAVIIDSAVDLAIEELVPDILCSALVDDCIQRGKHLKEGGAVYDFISDLQVGIANLGNSLAAIKKLVYDEKILSPERMFKAYTSDYEGADGEYIRQLVINKAAKYGEDNDEVDLLLRDAYNVYIGELKKYKNTRYGRGPIGCSYYAGTSSISANVPNGASIGATPDGRKAHAPLAEGCSPTQGSDHLGPTAVFNSVSKLPTSKICGGVLLNQKLSPQSVASETDKQKLIALIRTFLGSLKGWHVQYNIVSRDTLLDAQKNPEKHRDLIVRVAGYSAFFTVLSPETQNDIIARTEHAL